MSASETNSPAGPEYGGKDVKGGHPSGSPTPAQKDIDEGTGNSVAGYQKTPGIEDPGVPGSRTNPVEKGRKVEPEKEPSSGEVPAVKGELASDHMEE